MEEYMVCIPQWIWGNIVTEKQIIKFKKIIAFFFFHFLRNVLEII